MERGERERERQSESQTVLRAQQTFDEMKGAGRVRGAGVFKRGIGVPILEVLP